MMFELLNRKEQSPICSVENNASNSGVMAQNIEQLSINYQKKKSVKSFIPKLVKILDNLSEIDDNDNERDLTPFKIEDKIVYNKVQSNKFFIEDSSSSYFICEDAFSKLDNNKVGSKGKVLKSIKTLYGKEKGQAIKKYGEEYTDIECIRHEADNIIDNLVLELKKRVADDSEADEIEIEIIEDGINTILAYCFVECKILEKPVGDNIR